MTAIDPERTYTVPTGEAEPIEIRFPAHEDSLDQDEEWCEVVEGDHVRRIRFHDYHEVYEIPGLYEALFYRTLKCCSPARVVGLLDEVLSEERVDAEELRALDIGAGNGMVAEQLWSLGVSSIVGVDIIPEAESAAYRDRPYVYEDYHTVDLTELPEEVEKACRKRKLNCLVSVAALGYGDLPAKAFLQSLDLLESEAWLAFNIKEDFLYETDYTGFGELIDNLRRDRVIRLETYKRYRHRYSIGGKELFYVAVIARKLRDLPDGYLG